MYTRTQMERGNAEHQACEAGILAWHEKISGDIVIMNKPNWYLFESQRLRLDTLALVVRHERAAGHVRSELDQAWQIRRLRSRGPRGTIAFLLNVRPPNGCECRVCPRP